MKISHITAIAATFVLSFSTNAQSASTKDPLQSLAFLQGTWKANTNANGSSGGTASGTYTFALDLNGHALQRFSSVDKCSGPNSFDCQHHDQLTVYAGMSGALSAFYIDSEGHVIQYTVSTPDATTAVFASEGPADAPHFKLVYHLEKGLMTGKFQGTAPGSTEFHSYLEWAGAKQ